MGVLDGQRVLITGAGGGIGRPMVEQFRGAGARVAACDRTAATLDGVDAEHGEAFDLTDAAACRAALERIERAFGLPDVVVSNAGYTRAETLDDIDDSVWADEIDLNLSGARNITAPLLPGMRARGHGTLVFVSSVNALMHFGNPAYSAAKAGLLGYMRAIAVESGRHGIRANAICPGSVRTAAWDLRLAREPDVMDRVARLYPMGRLVEPVEVAHAAVFLASPLSSGITGVSLPVDAGITSGNRPFIDAIA